MSARQDAVYDGLLVVNAEAKQQDLVLLSFGGLGQSIEKYWGTVGAECYVLLNHKSATNYGINSLLRRKITVSEK